MRTLLPDIAENHDREYEDWREDCGEDLRREL